MTNAGEVAVTPVDWLIAPVVHAAVIVLQTLDGDECPALPWSCESPEIQQLTVRGVALARSGLSPEELHDAWCDGKRAQGWVYGETKDRALKTHPCLVAYAELPERQQAKDRLLRAITVALTGQAQRMRGVS